jgi:hypothetical protein
MHNQSVLDQRVHNDPVMWSGMRQGLRVDITLAPKAVYCWICAFMKAKQGHS